METKETTNIYHKLLEAQKEIGAIKKESENPYFNSKYFDINAILAVVKPILNKYGLVLTQALDLTTGKFGLLTTITDVDSGKEIKSLCPLPENLDAQKTGSAITYFRRYSLQSLLALEAEDDDGNVASGKSPDMKYEKVAVKKVREQKNTEDFNNNVDPF